MLRLNSFVLGNIMRSCTFYFQKTSQEQQSEKEVCIQHCQGNLLFRYAFWESTWQMNVVFVSSHSSLVLLVTRTGWFELSFKPGHWAQDLNVGFVTPGGCFNSISQCDLDTVFHFLCLALRLLDLWPLGSLLLLKLVLHDHFFSAVKI